MPVNAFERLMEAGKRKPAADPPADSENDEPARSSKAPKVKKLAPVKERFDWIIEVKGEDGNGRYFCSICSRDPVLLKAAEGKVEYFTNVGVEKAKDPGRKAEAHASKSSHHSALSRHNIASGNTKSAVQSLQDAALRAFQKSSAEDETYIKEYIKLGLWCASHEIPHTTAYEPLINLVSSYNGELLRWAQVRPANAHYRSKKTISEIIDLCSVVCDERVFQRLINGIERSGRFSLMIDETSLYGQSIMGVFARYVTCRGSIDVAEVREDLVVCCPLTSTKSAIIEETLVRELNDRGFNEAMWAKLGALSCDGAASMSSDNQGLYGRLKSRFGLEKLQFQHCRAHRVNLAAKAVLSSGDHVAIEDAINLTQDLYVYMAKSIRN
ncbi:hypothetical protein Pmar_PMAR017054 [Perkinsus marinus ATCC 50983]|uniref:DUF4371 domain-containing protein n=1 Tax=Perkinsus marinus (strain ATCC 50983 / TXsc) TaxID=423536 RepID=C5LSF5_PERM5|nr:hypothetical protein Pmar_PMAR017054 [Perkinsus marinus ATCC 50983]EER00196.1 hypothetical protein Pmar_PMAR017054 [Perkinsus marinus ATCC 50983]|eukprot:XP_002767478.1 hypothetical protein Pmar_PMAR017054 [Perkinsus marinus ATCC 50983]